MWKGVAIKESFLDQSIFSKFRIVGERKARLEKEENRGEFHFYSVEVSDEDIEDVVDSAIKSLKPSWYFHLVNGRMMKVMFNGKAFEINKEDTRGIKEVKSYGIEQGIHKEQLQIEGLFDNPFD